MSVIENNVIYSDDFQTVIGCSGYVSNIKINGKAKTILPRAFADHSELVRVELPSSMRSIGEYAFYNCPRLTVCNIPNGINAIGEYAFAKTGLKEVHLSDRLDELKNGVFSDCKFLEKVTLSDYIMQIDKDVFRGDDRLEEINIPEDLTYIGAGAFALCKRLSNITLNNNIKIIEENAFNGSNLEEISIPENVILVGKSAFDFNPIKRIDWNSNIELTKNNIKNFFNYCDDIKKVNIKGTEIDYDSFMKDLDEIVEIKRGNLFDKYRTDDFEEDMDK